MDYIKKVYNKSEARQKLPSLINEVRDAGTEIYISERGKTQAVLISYDQYLKMFRKNKKSNKELILELAGIWKDREDMKDSVKWVNQVRKEEERKFKLPTDLSE